MRYLIGSLIAVAVACFAFAVWGMATAEGRRAYDEMAGIIPMAAGLAGLVILVAAAAVWLGAWVRSKGR